MKTNAEGLNLIAAFKDFYEAAESRTNAEKAVNLYVKVRLTRNQFSALVSLVMQIGVEVFKKSKLLRMINRNERDSLVKAADQFDRYIYLMNEEGVLVLDEFLIKHRELEKALFLTPELVSKRRRKCQG